MKKLLFLILSYAFVSCNNSVDVSEKLISQEQATEMTSYYIESRYGLISNAIGKDDSNTAWYSIEELQGYLDYVKKEGKEKGYNVDGIRLFMAAYPDNQQYGEKAKLTTVILVPTGSQATSKKGFFQPNGEKPTANDSTGRQSQPQNITDIKALNFGGVGHPPKVDY